jgi:hypothetical protein
VVQCFYDSRYGQCLKLLDEMKDNFLLDIYLAQHVPTLFSMIRYQPEQNTGFKLKFMTVTYLKGKH